MPSLKERRRQLLDIWSLTASQHGADLERLVRAASSLGTGDETQESIGAWADETFGKPVSNLSIAARALSELLELVDKLTEDDNHPGAAEELADVRIVLVRLERNFNIQDEIDRKMKINRAREWTLDGNGHGQHK